MRWRWRERYDLHITYTVHDIIGGSVANGLSEDISMKRWVLFEIRDSVSEIYSLWIKPYENLDGGLEHFLFPIIYGIILPIDFHIFQDG